MGLALLQIFEILIREIVRLQTKLIKKENDEEREERRGDMIRIHKSQKKLDEIHDHGSKYPIVSELTQITD